MIVEETFKSGDRADGFDRGWGYVYVNTLSKRVGFRGRKAQSYRAIVVECYVLSGKANSRRLRRSPFFPCEFPNLEKTCEADT